MTHTTPYLPDPVRAQHRYVDAKVREHWHRQQLHKVRSALWKAGGHGERSRLVDDEALVEWLRAEAEHHMVYWRSVLHAQGVQAI